MINDPTPRSEATRPRAALIINGEPAAGLSEAEVDNNVYYHADTFRAVLALSAQPAGRGMEFWSSVTEAEVDVRMGYGDELPSLLVGVVDDIELDPVADEVRIVGRDLTARFVDNKIIEQYRNKTSSQIAQELAAKRGLRSQVQPTTTLAGKYYERDHVSVEDSRPEWDLLTYLAQQEGFRVFVQGRVLHFEPVQTEPEPFIVRWRSGGVPASNAMRLAMRRNLTVSRSIRVVVRSWNQKQQRGFTVEANRKRVINKTSTRGFAQTETPQQYTFTLPNATAQQAQDYANRRLEELSRHELQVRVTMPGDHRVEIDRPLRIEGTGSAFDQSFFPSSIVRRYSVGEGYLMDVTARNVDGNSTVLP